jgi:aryl-alcohol dehydrogenase-like predicted oxidoreductase
MVTPGGRVALGCGNFGGVGSAPEFFGQGLSRDQAFELMDAARELGITHFDTADAYGGGRSETAIGAWIRSRGAAPHLTTKTYNPMLAGADFGLKPERIARQLRDSLERLGVDRVDLYLAHEFDPDVPLPESIGAFEAAREAGLIGAYGVSNFDAAQLAAAIDAGAPQAIQNCYSLLETIALLADGRLRLRARKSMPMQQAAEAHRQLESGNVRERVILTLG